MNHRRFQVRPRGQRPSPHVVEGVQFSDGTCAVNRIVGDGTVTFYPNLAAVEGPGRSSLVIWLDPED